MAQVREFADQLWRGDASTADTNPVTALLGMEEYRPGLAFVSSFANVTAVRTGEGLVLIDTGSFLTGPGIRDQLREWSDAPVHTAIYTHGHIDHATGIGAFESEARPSATPALRVVGHRAVLARFERYRLTAGYNAAINARQFRIPGIQWPTEYRAPDELYDDRLSLQVGGVDFELHHARGETDDHTWLWIPEHRAVCTGDLFIWASPNCGNPQKVQRYPREWAAALRKMDALHPEVLFPGHGPPIVGAARVHQALTETASLLESLVTQTLAVMNQGAPLDEVLRAVRVPKELLARPYLRPVYDDPEFVVRNLWRLYGGWWDGNPARLKPPRDGELSAALCEAAGGAAVMAERARTALRRGRFELAGTLAQHAFDVAPRDATVREVYREVNEDRAREETSLMAQSIFRDAANRAG